MGFQFPPATPALIGAQRDRQAARQSVVKYMIKQPASPSQGCFTFLRNHSNSTQIAAMDLFVVPSVTFEWPRVSRFT
jgi:hypothetical protein